ncbi:MAG: Tim44/TimA family putative adaptor protein [Candidatus Midichloriaceae bacterium]
MDLIFLVAIAAFIIYKLFQSLGKEDKSLKQFKHIEPVLNSLKKHVNHIKNVEFEVISIKEANLSPKIKKVFEKLLREEKSFSMDNFIDGAKKAFKMILVAFNSNEIQTLKELLDYQLYRKFIKEISNRATNTVKQEVTLVGIKDVKIIDADIQDNVASIKLEIVSEQIIIGRDKDKKIVSGSANKILQICDIWTFNKQIKSGNLWQLTQTESK